MRFRSVVAFVAALALPAVTVPARAGGDPQTFVEGEHARLVTILHKPASPARDAEVDRGLGTFVDYDEMTRRTFGEPCHPSLPTCENLWSQLDDARKGELAGLMKQLLRKNYRKNLLKTLDFTVTYKGTKVEGTDTRVRTEAQDRLKPRESPLRIDYLVRQTPKGFVAVDFVTEDASMTKNYYTQFRDKMRDPIQGYPSIVAKLRDLIAKTP